MSARELIPTATSMDLAAAIVACVDAGVRIINLSLEVAHPSSSEARPLEEALKYAMKHGAIVVAAAGNQGEVGSSVITSHPWVIPVVACERSGRPMSKSNLGASIGRRGLSAPGEQITSLSSGGGLVTLGGSSVAAPFVTGALALLWSAFPAASATQIKLALVQPRTGRHNALVPPLLDAGSAYEFLSSSPQRRTA